MKIKHIFPLILLSGFTLNVSAQNNAPKAFQFAEHQTKLLLTETAKTKTAVNKPNLLSPRTLGKNGELVIVSPKDWCSGFLRATFGFYMNTPAINFGRNSLSPLPL
jgi:unsaturated chondroitin disaccharide hydrolase